LRLDRKGKHPLVPIKRRLIVFSRKGKRPEYPGRGKGGLPSSVGPVFQGEARNDSAPKRPGDLRGWIKTGGDKGALQKRLEVVREHNKLEKMTTSRGSHLLSRTEGRGGSRTWVNLPEKTELNGSRNPNISQGKNSLKTMRDAGRDVEHALKKLDYDIRGKKLLRRGN